MRNNLFKYLNLIIVLIAFTIIILLVSGVIAYWTDGLRYIASHTEQYSVSHVILIEDYEFEVNLENLAENTGKVILNDGENKIYINTIDTDDYSYRISFRSEGYYSFNGASLISGIKHASEKNKVFTTTTMSAKMFVMYQGTESQKNQMGVSGINYKNGDNFSFYLMKNNDYEGGIVKVKLTNLCKNIWTKNK